MVRILSIIFSATQLDCRSARVPIFQRIDQHQDENLAFLWPLFSARRPLVSSVPSLSEGNYKGFGVECIRKTPQRPTRADATILVAC